MLLTDLSDAEIVLGKLAARLVPVLGLLACALPLMEILTLLGGIDPDALLQGFTVSLGVALLGCSLALLCSLWVGKTHEALLCTYAILLLWLLSGRMIGFVGSTIGWALPAPPRRADPFFLALAPYWWPRGVSWSDYWWFLGVTSSISALLVAAAVLRLRSVCTRERASAVARTERSSRRKFLWWRFRAEFAWSTALLDHQPVLWREWHRSRPSRWIMFVMGLYAALAVFFSILVIITRAGQGPVFVNAFQVVIGFLLLAVTASSSLAEDRVRGSLDLLMSTPLETRDIVLGKWLGAYRHVPSLAILPALVVGSVGFLRDAPVSWAAPLMVVYVLATGAAITSLGLAMATCCSRPGRAVALTVTIYILVAVGWLFLVLMSFDHHVESAAVASPFMMAAMITYEAEKQQMMDASWAIVWTVVWALTGLGLALATLAQFDRRLGRMGDGDARLSNGSLLARAITAMCLTMAAVLSGATLVLDRNDASLVVSAPLFYFCLIVLAVLIGMPWFSRFISGAGRAAN